MIDGDVNKILNATDEDFDEECGDWTIGDAEKRFISGGYTHIKLNNEIISAEVITFNDKTQGFYWVKIYDKRNT